jgi:hypothetical protein
MLVITSQCVQAPGHFPNQTGIVASIVAECAQILDFVPASKHDADDSILPRLKQLHTARNARLFNQSSSNRRAASAAVATPHLAKKA